MLEASLESVPRVGAKVDIDFGVDLGLEDVDDDLNEDDEDDGEWCQIQSLLMRSQLFPGVSLFSTLSTQLATTLAQIVVSSTRLGLTEPG